jgi:hypothetical protein
VTHLAASLFFTSVLLAAVVVIHMNVRLYWAEILLALKGEWNGIDRVRPSAARPKSLPAFARPPRRAAF